MRDRHPLIAMAESENPTEKKEGPKNAADKLQELSIALHQINTRLPQNSILLLNYMKLKQVLSEIATEEHFPNFDIANQKNNSA